MVQIYAVYFPLIIIIIIIMIIIIIIIIIIINIYLLLNKSYINRKKVRSILSKHY